MRVAEVFYKRESAGILTQNDDGSFTFRYHDHWLTDAKKEAIAFAFPKTQQEYHSPYLFAFFFNILPEGENKECFCRTLKIDDDDYFGLLLVAARHDSIGAITVKPILQ
jgi:possible hipA-like protein